MGRAELAGARWPLPAIEGAVHHLATRAGFAVRRPSGTELGATPSTDPDRWIAATATALGLEAVRVEIPYAELPRALRRVSPAIVASPDGSTVLAVTGSTRSRLQVLSFTTGQVASLPFDVVCDALGGAIDPRVAAKLERATAGLPAAMASRVRGALLDERQRTRRFTGCWLLRPPAGTSLWAQARSEGLPRRALSVLVLHVLQIALTIAGWTILGQAALQGRLESGWMLAWGLLLSTFVPVYLAQAWIRGTLAIDFGRLLKRRLLAGALRLDRELVRREGAGQLVGRALETNAIDELMPRAGLTAALASLELLPIGVWVAFGTGGLLHAAGLLAFVIATAILAWRAYRRTVEWTEARRSLTHELVERMAGHRTRLAQRDPRRWHEGEDEHLARYGELGAAVDRFEVLAQLVPYGWLVVGLCMIAPGFVRGDDAVALAIGLGGTVFGFASLAQLTQGLRPVLEALAGWRQMAPLHEAAGRPTVEPSPAIAVLEPRRAATARADGHAPTLLSATGLSLHYPGRARPVLDDVSLTIEHGDRILLEGPSGGGKTTLASVLSGLLRPSSGLVLLDGFDHPTLGDRGWRARIAVAAQYHDNHVFAETLAFNALLGRPGWPGSNEDLDELHEVCRELGLHDLIERMAGGVWQNVGEGGWQLSHGERSRIFIARALLQKSPLVVLDESFAALDPETLEACLRCVLRRAQTLLVIAHP